MQGVTCQVSTRQIHLSCHLTAASEKPATSHLLVGWIWWLTTPTTVSPSSATAMVMTTGPNDMSRRLGPRYVFFFVLSINMFSFF
jgi:hypothetical protein